MPDGLGHELAVAAERGDDLVVADARAELGHDVVAEQRLHRVLLEAPDPVVADDRDDVHAVAHERLEVAEREPDRAVAEQQHDLAVGVRDGRPRARSPGPFRGSRTGPGRGSVPGSKLSTNLPAYDTKSPPSPMTIASRSSRLRSSP